MYIELLFADFLLIPAFGDGGGRHFWKTTINHITFLHYNNRKVHYRSQRTRVLVLLQTVL